MASLRGRTAVNVLDYATGLRYLPWHPIAGAEDDPPADPPKDPPQDPPKDPPADPEKRYTQAQLEQATRDAIARERRKADETARKAAEEAEAKKLADEKEWQKLAAKHEERVKELEPTAQLAERYKVALTAQLETLRKDLPPHLIELLDPMDVAAQLEWLAKHQDVIRAAPPASNGGGPPATPPAANSNETPEQRQARMEKKLVSSGAYDRL